MLGRSCRSAFICLRCQHRRARGTQHQPWLALENRSQAIPTSRRQSTAAAIIVEEEDDIYDSVPTSPKTPSKDRKRRRLKDSWRQNEVAQLGVASLGKPAEVILLKDRDRIIPKLPAELDKDHKNDVLESLHSENQPLNPEQLKKNIEQIRAQVGQQRGQLDEEKWKQVKKALLKGFAQKQLQTYIEQNQTEAAKPFFHKFKTVRWSMKQQMTHYIAKHIWGFSGPDTAELQQKQKDGTSTEIKMSGPELDVLLLQENTSLRDISEQHKVQIDVFREPAKIILSGPSVSIKAAKALLETLSSKVTKTRFVFHHPTKSVPTALLQDLRRRYRVHISLSAKKNAIDVYHHAEISTDLVSIRRQLLLGQRGPSIPHRSVIWPESSAESIIAIPMGLSVQTSRDTRKRLNRFVASGNPEALRTIRHMTAEQQATFKSTYKSVWKALSTPTQMSQLIVSHSALREEGTATYGQALFERDRKASDVLNLDSKADPLFISEIPLLPQFLAKRKMWKEREPQKKTDEEPSETALKSSPESDQGRIQPFNYRLVLNPVQDHLPLPPLEISLSGSDFNKGLKQPLQIQRIAATLDERKGYLLLPSRPVDIQFRKQIKQDLYVTGVQTDPVNGKLLSQLAEYFNEAAGMTEPTFAPFTKLDLPKPLLKHALKARNTIPDAKSPKVLSPGSAEYVLTSATVIDQASFHTPVPSSGLRMDHVAFMGDHWEGDRRALKLTHQSAGGKKISFATFFNSAYEIALLLGEPGLLRTTRG